MYKLLLLYSRMAKLKQISLFDFDFSEPEKEEIVVPKEKENVDEESNHFITNSAVVTESTSSYHIKEKESFVAEAVLEIAQQTTSVSIADLPKKTKGVRGRKSIKMMEAEADLIELPTDEELFSKMYYPMSAITQMFKVNHSLIRFWENEFTILQPRKNKKGDRLFRPEDVKNLQLIYHLLRVKKFTIDGAKDYLKNQKKQHQQFEAVQKLERLKHFLLEIKANLS